MARQFTFGTRTSKSLEGQDRFHLGRNMDNSAGPFAMKIYKALEAATIKNLVVIDPKRTPMQRGAFIYESAPARIPH